MTGLEVAFPDIEDRLIVGLPVLLAAAGMPGVVTGSSTPSDLTAAGVKGFLRIALVDDPDDSITRAAIVDIDCFATTRRVAYDVSQKVRGILMSARSVDGMVIDSLRTVSGPKRVPWDNSNIRRLLATYRISTRR